LPVKVVAARDDGKGGHAILDFGFAILDWGALPDAALSRWSSAFRRRCDQQCKPN
jgi:hypothetical protein